MTGASVPTGHPMVDVLNIDGDLLLYDGQQLRLLAGTAAMIWRAIDGASDTREIATSLAQSSPDPTRVVTEVTSFLEHLADVGVVEVAARRSEPAHACPGHVGFTSDGTTTLLVDLRDGRRRALADAGAQIWHLTLELRYASLVVDALRARYTGATDTVARDVDALVQALVDEGFLVRRHGSGRHPSS